MNPVRNLEGKIMANLSVYLLELQPENQGIAKAIDHPSCSFEEWSHEIHGMKACGKPAVCKVGGKGNNFLCQEHDSFVRANAGKNCKMFGTTGAAIYKWQDYVAGVANIVAEIEARAQRKAARRT